MDLPVSKLPNDVVRVWLADPGEFISPAALEWFHRLLDPEERERRLRFKFERDRHLYLISHGLTRVALSECAGGVPPEEWRFVRNRWGRPEIALPKLDKALRFNLSHTHGLAAVAVLLDAEVGIDVERLDRIRDSASLAKHCLSDDEQARFWAFTEDQHSPEFLRYWTLKEATIKALGTGLSTSLRSFTIKFRNDIPVDVEGAPGAGSWQIAEGRPTPGHYLGLAVRHDGRGPYRIEYRRFTAADAS
jgi:4'-phosphopantetheinyl transferase